MEREGNIQKMTIPIKIGTLNSRGGDNKVSSIIEIFNTNKLDICLLQETHNIKEVNVKKIENRTKTKIFKSPGSQVARGVLIMVKENEYISNPRMKYRDQDGNQ